MWDSDYPHMEGTWPHTMESLQATFGPVEEAHEIRARLGGNAASAFGFDTELMQKVADRVGPMLEEIAKRI